MIWLIGSRGMLGMDVEELILQNGLEYISSDMDVDITQYRELEGFAGDKPISWIINCSAYTAVDRAEDEPHNAFQVNAQGVENIACLASKRNSRIIHISTDYVFDGHKQGAYTEQDRANPQGVYGRTKLEGERRLKNAAYSHFIIRTAWLYGRHGPNFVYTMLRLFKQKQALKVVSDQYGSPTFTRDLAEVLVEIVKQDSRCYGTYHFTNRGRTTWYDFAKRIYCRARESGIIDREVEINPVSTAE
ncbi:MAG: dTDP-4-dehydrorhamnose reductase, partial [Spirochaetota bacterium]